MIVKGRETKEVKGQDSYRGPKNTVLCSVQTPRIKIIARITDIYQLSAKYSPVIVAVLCK